MPTTVFVDAEGTVVEVHNGALSRRRSRTCSTTCSAHDRRAAGARLHRRHGRDGQPVRLRHAARLPLVLPRARGPRPPRTTQGERRPALCRRRLTVSAGFLVVFGIGRPVGQRRRAVVHRLRQVGDDRDRDRPRRAGYRHARGLPLAVRRPRVSTRVDATGRSARSSCSACRTRSRRSRARCRCSSSLCSARSHGRTSLRAWPPSSPTRSGMAWC